MRAWILAAAAVVLASAASAAGKPVADKVVVDLSKQVNSFTPNDVLGAALDGMEKGEVKLYLTPFNIQKMQSSGIRRVTYRTRPELGIKVWHWTEEGTWSDPEHKQGYWTGSDHPTKEPTVTWGYNLPRRGDSIDNASNVGYSRLDDGDPASFWKSNPYLDRRYTGLSETRPSWIVLSFEKTMRVDAARIQWAAPYATHFLVQYWDGKDEFWEGKELATEAGGWKTFPHGDVTTDGKPNDGVLRLADAPVAVHFLRILMLSSSETAPEGSSDVRDKLGYAVREVGFGALDAKGGFTDVVRHGKTKETQTVIQVSSTDPWHRAVDRDPGTEQPSLDFVFKSGLNGGLPLMIPVGVYYDTPENALAEIRYVKRRGWPVTQVELGEEPDGQFIRPEDYADLYVVWARKIHELDPKLQLGGPSMQGALTGTWPDTQSGTSWMGRFVAELKARDGLDQFQFYSFEHYAFDDVCGAIDEKLRQEDVLLDNIITQNTEAGVPRTIPWIITEYGLSPFSGRQMSDMGGALYAADVVGHFMSKGGGAAYMFGYTPDEPINQNFPCAGFGNMMLFQADDNGRSKWVMPMYWGEHMMLHDWAAPLDKPHRLFAASSSSKDKKGRAYVVVYPLLAQDGRWSVMLVNRDTRAHDAAVDFRTGGAMQALGKGATLDEVQYSKAQYAYTDRGEKSRPTKDDPPVRGHLKGGRPIHLPAMSLTVVSGAGPQP
ncbi:MAG TPA: discoidin domain-containing protein [Caulobacteraceae bacterium]